MRDRGLLHAREVLVGGKRTRSKLTLGVEGERRGLEFMEFLEKSKRQEEEEDDDDDEEEEADAEIMQKEKKRLTESALWLTGVGGFSLRSSAALKASIRLCSEHR
ncbi:hypothetical protein H110_04507 [Trichophyton rubrum MR1448]|nr:hypothetical protein H110_04507 [Trichophyton rubrum MR1448]